MVSVDEELAATTNQSLSMGPSVMSDFGNVAFVLPPLQKLHPNLYNNSLSDVPMDALKCDKRKENAIDSNGGNICGVPGFPDFPDFWQGESSADRKNKHQKNTNQCSKLSRRKCGRKKVVRKAVNKLYGSIADVEMACVKPGGKGAGREVKKQLRTERMLRRKEKIAQLQNRRRRKRDMGDICRGLASINCK